MKIIIQAFTLVFVLLTHTNVFAHVYYFKDDSIYSNRKCSLAVSRQIRNYNGYHFVQEATLKILNKEYTALVKRYDSLINSNYFVTDWNSDTGKTYINVRQISESEIEIWSSIEGPSENEETIVYKCGVLTIEEN